MTLTILQNDRNTIKIEKRPAIRIDADGRFVLNKAMKDLLELENEEDGIQMAISENKELFVGYSTGAGSYIGSFKPKENSWRFTSKGLAEQIILNSFLAGVDDLYYPMVLITSNEDKHFHEGRIFYELKLR